MVNTSVVDVLLGVHSMSAEGDVSIAMVLVLFCHHVMAVYSIFIVTARMVLQFCSEEEYTQGKYSRPLVV